MKAMSVIEKKSKFTQKRKKKVILVVLLSISLVLTGVGIPMFFYVHKRIKVFTVTDIQSEQDIVAGSEVILYIIAKHYGSVPDPSIRTYTFPNRCTKKLHIRVIGYDPSLWSFSMVEIINQTVKFVFPTAGTWQLVAGEYTTEITVS